jgi:hypothetical protein
LLGPFLCGLFCQAPLLPKLRGHFAEFLNNTSSAGLGILSPSTCVGLRYGPAQNNSGFSRQEGLQLPYYTSVRVTVSAYETGFLISRPARLHRYSHSRPCSRLLCPHSSVCTGCRNLHLLSIGYAFRPRLRPRLSQGRSALPWKPWIFGHRDSHPVLATHSGILSSWHSTAPHGTASARQQCSSTNHFRDSRASAACLSPGHFRRRASRLVSYYALFE